MIKGFLSQLNSLFITIDITNFVSGNNVIDEFLYFANYNRQIYQIANYMNHNNKNSDPSKVYKFIMDEFQKYPSKPIIEWISYSQITRLTKIAEGEFGIVYKAIRLNRGQKETVAIKRFFNFQNISKPFLNEVII